MNLEPVRRVKVAFSDERLAGSKGRTVTQEVAEVLLTLPANLREPALEEARQRRAAAPEGTAAPFEEYLRKVAGENTSDGNASRTAPPPPPPLPQPPKTPWALQIVFKGEAGHVVIPCRAEADATELRDRLADARRQRTHVDVGRLRVYTDALAYTLIVECAGGTPGLVGGPPSVPVQD